MDGECQKNEACRLAVVAVVEASSLEVGTLVCNSLQHLVGSRLMLGNLVIMPNYVHALIKPLAGFELEDILHSIKSYSANKINKLLGREGRSWQKESYDHIVRDDDELEAFQAYIATNPSKANIRVEPSFHRAAKFVQS